MPITDLSGVQNIGTNEATNAINNQLGKNAELKGVLQDAGIIKNNQFADDSLNGFVKGLHTTFGAVNDPTYLGFTLLFDWYTSPLFKGGLNSFNPVIPQPSDFGPQTSSNSNEFPMGSALRYLKFRNEDKRIKSLQQFITHLNIVNKEMPWYWQGITGLDTVYKKHNDMSEPYRGGDDSVIIINTLESVDMKISGLMNLYRNSILDFSNRRKVIPDNGLYFNLYIYVEEIRKFNTFTSLVTQGLQAIKPSAFSQGNPLFEEIKQNTTRIVIELKNCTFMPEESSDVFTNVGNVLPQQAVQKISIKYRDISFASDLAWLNYSINDKDGNRFDDMSKKILSQANRAADFAVSLVKSNTIGKLGRVDEKISSDVNERIVDVLSRNNLGSLA
jgi:hypothetical protein